MLKEIAGLPAGIQALEAIGTVTATDYERVFAPMVEKARWAGGRMRLLYEFGPGFQRITAGALWADTRLGSGYLRLLDGCAVVSEIGWIRVPSCAIHLDAVPASGVRQRRTRRRRRMANLAIRRR